MSKSRRTETSRKAERQENPLLEAVVAARSDLRALVMDAGFGVLGSLLEEDRRSSAESATRGHSSGGRTDTATTRARW